MKKKNTLAKKTTNTTSQKKFQKKKTISSTSTANQPAKKKDSNSNDQENLNEEDKLKKTKSKGSLQRPSITSEIQPVEKVNTLEPKEVIETEKESIVTDPKEPERNKNIRVYVRFRPFNEVETGLLNDGVGWTTPIYKENNVVQIDAHRTGSEIGPLFKFDKVFTSDSPQQKLYDFVGKEIVKDVTDGYNGTIFAYGQSGSGKTFTMYGRDVDDEETKGLIPRIVEAIFEYVDTTDENNVSFQFKLSVMQIYKEVIYDLLTGEKELKIKESPIKGIYVENLSEVYLSSVEDFLNYHDIASANRKVGETKLNQTSSRSHSIMILEVTQTFKKENLIKRGLLNLVDLAGSEKISKTGAVGETLEEAKKINLSLSALGNVIHALTSNSEHIPYRDSKLTRILQESLGGNYKTSLIVTASPHSYHLEETLSSLQFAQRAKTIKNKVKVNIRYTYEELQNMVMKLTKKLENANNTIKKLMSGQKIEDLDIENKDNANNMCANCEILKEDKTMLEDKVKDLMDQITEQNNKIKELNDQIDELKANGNNNNNSNENDKSKFIELYENIKKKLEDVKNENDLLKKYNDEFNFDKEFMIKKENFNNIMDDYVKNSDKIKYFDEINNLTKECFKNNCLSERNYSEIYDLYKKKLNEIFIQTFNNENNIINENENNINNNENEKNLLLFSTNFFFNFCSLYFNCQLQTQNEQKLILDNSSLFKMNQILLNLVDGLINTNYEIANNNTVTGTAVNFLRSSFLGTGDINQNLLNQPKPKRMSISAFAGNFGNNMVKVVSRKSIAIMNKFAGIPRRGSFMPFMGLPKFNSNNNSNGSGSNTSSMFHSPPNEKKKELTKSFQTNSQLNEIKEEIEPSKKNSVITEKESNNNLKKNEESKSEDSKSEDSKIEEKKEDLKIEEEKPEKETNNNIQIISSSEEEEKEKKEKKTEEKLLKKVSIKKTKDFRSGSTSFKRSASSISSKSDDSFTDDDDENNNNNNKKNIIDKNELKKNELLTKNSEIQNTQIKMIKDNLIMNIKETEHLKEKLETVKTDFNNIIQFNKDYFEKLIKGKNVVVVNMNNVKDMVNNNQNNNIIIEEEPEENKNDNNSSNINISKEGIINNTNNNEIDNDNNNNNIEINDLNNNDNNVVKLKANKLNNLRNNNINENENENDNNDSFNKNKKRFIETEQKANEQTRNTMIKNDLIENTETFENALDNFKSLQNNNISNNNKIINNTSNNSSIIQNKNDLLSEEESSNNNFKLKSNNDNNLKSKLNDEYFKPSDNIEIYDKNFEERFDKNNNNNEINNEINNNDFINNESNNNEIINNESHNNDINNNDNLFDSKKIVLSPISNNLNFDNKTNIKSLNLNSDQKINNNNNYKERKNSTPTLFEDSKKNKYNFQEVQVQSLCLTTKHKKSNSINKFNDQQPKQLLFIQDKGKEHTFFSNDGIFNSESKLKTVPKTRNSNNDIKKIDNNKLYNKFSQTKNSGNIEEYVKKYLESGSATRRFDGIKVDYENGKLNYRYIIGLGARNKVEPVPLQLRHIHQLTGDQDSFNDPSILMKMFEDNNNNNNNNNDNNNNDDDNQK